MKIVIFALFITLSTFSIHAQKIAETVSFIGFKQGVSASRVYFSPIVDQDFIFGYSGGLVFNNINKEGARLGVQIELNFSQQGWAERLEGDNHYSRQLSYINFPFLSHAEFGNEKTNLILHFGPFVSYMLSEKEDMSASDDLIPRIYYNRQVQNAFGYGLCGGIGVSQKTAVGVFQLEGRFTQNLSDLFNNTPSFRIPSSKNQSIEFTIAYLIPLNK